MNQTLMYILTGLLVADALVVIVTILFQSSKSEGISGALTGTAETFFGKNKARSLDAKLSKLTAWAAGIFVALTFVLSIF